MAGDAAPTAGAPTREWLPAVWLVVGPIVMAAALFVDVSAVYRVVAFVIGAALLQRGVLRVVPALVGRPVDIGFWAAVGWTALVVLGAALVDFLPVGEARDLAAALDVDPLLRPDLLSAHPLGTDRQGLDQLGQLFYGARVSLQVGIGGVGLGMLVGGTLGILAGYFGGRIRAGVALLTDTIMGFPPIILLLGLVTILDPSVQNLVFGLAVLGVPSYARLALAHTLTQRRREYVLAAQALGAGHRRILLREIVPNVSLPLLAYSFVILAVLIVAEASLSYLGLGIQRPDPTWGNMIAAAQDDFERHPHLVFVPGVVIFVTVYALNRIGDRLAAGRGGGDVVGRT